MNYAFKFELLMHFNICISIYAKSIAHSIFLIKFSWAIGHLGYAFHMQIPYGNFKHNDLCILNLI